MAFWNRKKNGDNAPVKLERGRAKVTCSRCKAVYEAAEAAELLFVCPTCKKYMNVGAKDRLLMVLDDGLFEPWFEDVEAADPLKTPGYPEKVAAAQKKSGASEAVTIGKGTIGGLETVIGVCDPNFMIGSMGSAMGERITQCH